MTHMPAILLCMRENRQREAWYSPQAIGQRPFHTRVSVLEDLEGPAAGRDGGGEKISRKVDVSRQGTSMLSYFPIAVNHTYW